MQDYKKGSEEFYARNKGLDLESLSGHSSTLLSTYYFREYLKKLFVDKKIKSVSDCPCGDWNWMRSVKLDGIKYTGYDILPKIVEENKIKFPAHKFEVFDAIEYTLPKADLIVCKDFLTHITDDLIEKVIDNFKKSKSKYLVSTSYVKTAITNMEKDWGFKEVNLEKFGLKPIEKQMDSPNRYHGLYELK